VDVSYVRRAVHFPTPSVAESMGHTATGPHKTWKGLGIKWSWPRRSNTGHLRGKNWENREKLQPQQSTDRRGYQPDICWTEVQAATAMVTWWVIASD